MNKNFKILTLIIAALMLLTTFSCSGEKKLKDGESYAFSEDGLYSFVYVHDDYELVNFSGGESVFIVDNISIQVKSIVEQNPSKDGLDDVCETLHYYYAIFEDFDFSNYETVKLNKMKDVRYYEKHIEAEDADLVMKPATVQVYIFAGENAYYLITAGYMDYAKDEAVKTIRNLIDTFEERTQEEE